MNKFIKDKWYKINHFRDNSHYFKFDYLEDRGGYNRVHCKILIWAGNIKSGDTFANTEAEQSATLLTDLSEIIPYLPKDHIDRPKLNKEQKKNILQLIREI